MLRPLTISALVALAPASAWADTAAYPLLSLDGLTAHDVIGTPTTYRGFDGLHVTVAPDHKSIEQGGCDNCTFLSVDDASLQNGVIEIAVAGKPQDGAPAWARGFVGVVFRADLDADRYEGVYLRPLNADAATQLQRNHTVQYFSYPDHPWHQLRKDTPGAYESYAPMTVGEWTRLRVVVDGPMMRLFVNDAPTPALVVNDLKLGAEQSGTIGLFTEPGTDAYFRNLVVTPRPAGFAGAIAEPLSETAAQALIRPFYDLFSLRGSVDDARAAFAPEWRSYYSADSFRTLDETLAFVGENWATMLPDSAWRMDDIAVTRDNEIIVRGTLTGTPAGERFFGAPVTGKSISVMTLDMHKTAGGKIVETHHVEDWARGLRQLAE